MAVLLSGRGRRCLLNLIRTADNLIRTADKQCFLAGISSPSGGSAANRNCDIRWYTHDESRFRPSDSPRSRTLHEERRACDVQGHDWFTSEGHVSIVDAVAGANQRLLVHWWPAHPASREEAFALPVLRNQGWRKKGGGLVARNFFRGFSSDVKSGEKEEETETIAVTFVNKDGSEEKLRVPLGKSMLEAAHENDIELEGACEGSLACSTCHVIVTDEEYYRKMPEPTDEENDMLDLAFGLSDTSRLGCQIIAKKEIDGIRLAIPAATRNFAVDGHVPKPH
ncbi:hypothetical protein CBR_g29317 [Chara braunii]|uniref:2Fe-2S ferredoxin n=1 Tax=Chara braunii TaxID=69332 RepID=A0A388JWH5_CHABU|nr:hypothetical protein CBR_g29317 [Chara braunii]|eukprot:GBG62117.1 hypothetical protein CBR_g29317 [Chara braunii]